MPTRRRSWLVLVLCVAACSSPGGEDLGECPQAADQQRSAGAFVLFSTCAGCHSSKLEGDARRGAPPGQDFDRMEIIRDMAGDIYRTARDGSMPPPTSDVPRLSEPQVEALRVYLACEPG